MYSNLVACFSLLNLRILRRTTPRGSVRIEASRNPDTTTERNPTKTERERSFLSRTGFDKRRITRGNRRCATRRHNKHTWCSWHTHTRMDSTQKEDRQRGTTAFRRRADRRGHRQGKGRHSMAGNVLLLTIQGTTRGLDQNKCTWRADGAC